MLWTYLRCVADGCPVQVDDGERGTAAPDGLHRLHERLPERILRLVFRHHEAPNAERILVDANQVPILEYLGRLLIERPQIVRHVQRRGPDRPQGHLSPLLV